MPNVPDNPPVTTPMSPATTQYVLFLFSICQSLGIVSLLITNILTQSMIPDKNKIMAVMIVSS